MWVARLMTTSCFSTAWFTASGWNRSSSIGSAPSWASWRRDSWLRPRPVTRCPAATNNGIARIPTTPVAPVRKMRIVYSPIRSDLTNHCYRRVTPELQEGPRACADETHADNVWWALVCVWRFDGFARSRLSAHRCHAALQRRGLDG